MNNFKVIILFVLGLSLVSCASNRKEKTQELSKVKIEEKLIKGKSTKANVVEVLGSPEMVNSDSDGKEQWVYSKHSSSVGTDSVGMGMFVAGISSAFLGVGFDGSSSKTEAQSKTVTLTVYFDQRGILDRYSYSHSKI